MGVVFVWGHNKPPEMVQYFSSYNISIEKIVCMRTYFYALRTQSNEVYKFTWQAPTSKVECDSRLKNSGILHLKESYVTACVPTDPAAFTIIPFKSTLEKFEMIVDMCTDGTSLFVLTSSGRVFQYQSAPYLNSQNVANMGLHFSLFQPLSDTKVMKIDGASHGLVALTWSSNPAQCQTGTFILPPDYHSPAQTWKFSLKGVIDSQDGIRCVTCNGYRMIVITNFGRVFVKGPNTFHTLGFQSMVHDELAEWETYPRGTDPSMENSDLFCNVQMGNTHTLLSTIGGTVYTIGRDYAGLYTRESMFDDKTPRAESYLAGVIAVCCSQLTQPTDLSVPSLYPQQSYHQSADYHNLALVENGSVFGWGSNHTGCLGCILEKKQTLFPTLIDALYGNKVLQISAGYLTSACVAEQPCQAFPNAVNNEQLSDIVFNSSEPIYAHKCILLARCPMLLALIEGKCLIQFLAASMLDGTDSSHAVEMQLEQEESYDTLGRLVVEIPSILVSSSVLINFLNYIYTDEIHLGRDASQEWLTDHVASLLKLAKLFHLLECEYLAPIHKKPDTALLLTTTLISNLGKKIATDYNTKNQETLDFRLNEIYVNATKKVYKRSSRKYLSRYASRLSNLLSVCVNRLNYEDNIFKTAKVPFENHMLSIFNAQDTYADWKIQVETKSGKKQIIPIHKLIVTSKLDFFKAILLGDLQMQESTSEFFELQEFNSEIIIPMLAYVYGTTTQYLNQGNLCESLICADYFSYNLYKKVLEYEISQYLNKDTIFPLLNVCTYYEAYFLRERCFIYAISHFEELQQRKGYSKIPKETKDAIERRAIKSGKKLLAKEMKKEQTTPVATTPTVTNQSSSTSIQTTDTRPKTFLGSLRGLLWKSNLDTAQAEEDLNNLKGI